MLNADSGHIGNGIKKLYDPIERAEETARIVCRGDERRYIVNSLNGVEYGTPLKSSIYLSETYFTYSLSESIS